MVGTIPCRACGDPTGDEPLIVREMMFGTRATFEYRQCPTCSSLTLARIPDDLGSHYPPGYYSNTTRRAIVQDAAWRRPFVRILTTGPLFGRSARGMRIARRVAERPDETKEARLVVRKAELKSFRDGVLDVGCGAQPDRLALLRKVGFSRLVGVEPFLPSSTTWQGIPVRKAQLSDIGGRWKLIMFHHSLEHVRDPVDTLRQARDRLAHDGLVQVRTPIVGGWFWQTYGPDWAEIDAPRHTVVFSLDGLRRAAAAAGFSTERIAWESGSWEVIASEQYQRDIAMYEPRSWMVDHQQGDYDRRLAQLDAHVKELNATGLAGRCEVWLRPVPS